MPYTCYLSDLMLQLSALEWGIEVWMLAFLLLIIVALLKEWQD